MELLEQIVWEVSDSLTLFRLACASRQLREVVHDYVRWETRLLYPWKFRRLKTTIAYAYYTATKSFCTRCGRVASYHKRDHRKHCQWCGPGCSFRHSLDLVTQRPYKNYLRTDAVENFPFVTLLTSTYSTDRWCAVRGRFQVVGAVNTGVSIISVLVWVEDQGQMKLWADRHEWEVDVFITASLL